jgi:putative transposase
MPQFGQPRFYDFNVWSLKKKIEKLQDMHMNPVQRGLVSHPKAWPWSGFSFQASKDAGLIRINPLGRSSP